MTTFTILDNLLFCFLQRPFFIIPLLHGFNLFDHVIVNGYNNIQHYPEWDGKVCSVTWIISAIHQLKSGSSAFFKVWQKC